MSKGTKKVLGAIIIIILIVAVSWLVYRGINTETTSINPENEIQNENMGVYNAINDVVTNQVEEEPINEVLNEVVEEEVQEEEENVQTNSEVVEGTATSREERAVELAREYYEQEYGTAEEIYFSYQGINGNGSYIVRAGNADSGSNMFLLVDLDTEEVTEK